MLSHTLLCAQEFEQEKQRLTPEFDARLLSRWRARALSTAPHRPEIDRQEPGQYTWPWRAEDSSPPRRCPEAGGLFNLLDDDDSGTIQFEEFLQGCLNLKGGGQKMDIMHLPS